MPLRREHRWFTLPGTVLAQCSFEISVVPDEVMLRSAWQRSGLNLSFEECMSDPVLARILHMMARQGTKHKKPLEANMFKNYFTQQEEKLLLSTVRQHTSDIYAERDYWWMVLARHTAVRVCVLSGLTVGDAQSAIARERLVIRPEINKRNKRQELFCKKIIMDALKNLLRIHKKLAGAQAFSDLTFEQRPLILSRKQQGMSIRSFQERMNRWCKKAGISGSPHWWRHTWAKRQVEASDDVSRTLMKVQLWLGHDDPKTTAIYTRPDKQEMDTFGRYTV